MIKILFYLLWFYKSVYSWKVVNSFFSNFKSNVGNELLIAIVCLTSKYFFSFF